MHELSVADSIVRTAADHVPEGKILQAVHVTVGPLSGISADALEFCFSAVAQDLGYTSAKLLITSIPAEFQCLSCDLKYESQSVFDPCPACSSNERITLSGDRFSLDAIDVEDEDHV